MVFVIFNKVCTAQLTLLFCHSTSYGNTAFLPLIFPLTRLRLKWKGVAMMLRARRRGKAYQLLPLC
ncbi:hypothetical protein GQ600_6695 [Phytophthora cactorum]|nr:hypothetical protein GQ600_6695 [Phytophthora cactorum]